MNVIGLIVDRWHIGHVGAYGNTWIETPSLDRLACESFVFDQALTAGLRIDDFYAAFMQGRHPLQAERERARAVDFLSRLGERRIHTTLLTDEPALAGHRLVGPFDEVVELERPGSNEPAEEVGDTHLARCFAQAIDWLTSAEGPFLAWIHLSSLGMCWDAPYAFRASYAEPGDPEPPYGAEVPKLLLPADYDPDLLLGMVQAYAGQVSLLDVCLGALVEAIDELNDETLLAVCGARGFPLGEHGQIGEIEETLHAESVHVPMMVRFPQGLGAARRSQALVTPADLRATLCELWSIEDVEGATIGQSLMPIVRGEAEAVRDRLLLGSLDGETAIRTPGWFMRLTDEPRLYAKPDDRWEVNDVADRCAEVVDGLREAAVEYRRWLDSDGRREIGPLNDLLQNGME